jgi:hypothetical protein
MGLDMYLTKRLYVGAEYEHRKVTGKIDIKIDGKKLPVNFSKISYIEERAAYWRKANQIHQWFVDNVQSGNDDCGRYDVSKEQLRQLIDLCKQVQAKAKVVEGQVLNGETWSKGEHTYNYEPGKVIVNQDEIAEILPTASGFFFGGTDYDEYYMQDIQSTIDQLEPLLADEEEYPEYTYQASW